MLQQNTGEGSWVCVVPDFFRIIVIILLEIQGLCCNTSTAMTCCVLVIECKSNTMLQFYNINHYYLFSTLFSAQVACQWHVHLCCYAMMCSFHVLLVFTWSQTLRRMVQGAFLKCWYYECHWEYLLETHLAKCCQSSHFFTSLPLMIPYFPPAPSPVNLYDGNEWTLLSLRFTKSTWLLLVFIFICCDSHPRVMWSMPDRKQQPSHRLHCCTCVKTDILYNFWAT